jgi:hypothetical protein
MLRMPARIAAGMGSAVGDFAVDAGDLACAAGLTPPGGAAAGATKASVVAATGLVGAIITRDGLLHAIHKHRKDHCHVRCQTHKHTDIHTRTSYPAGLASITVNVAVLVAGTIARFI